MAQNKILNIEPAALGTVSANILNCNITSLAGPVGYTQTQPYLLLKHIRVVNNDTNPHPVSCYKGTTAGSAVGTEFAFSKVSVPANSYVDWYGQARFDAADFLTGYSDTANKLTINIDGEIGIS